MDTGPVVEDCPFCGFKPDSEYQIMLHMETLHAEGESPFVVKDDASIAAVMSVVSDPIREDVGDVQYANCPVEGCGEILLLEDFDSHIRLHDVEDSEAEVDAAEIDSTKRVKLNSEGSSSFATKLSRALRNLDADDEHVGKSSSLSNGVSDQQEKAKIAWKNLMKMPEASSKPQEPSSTCTNKPPKKRLGKAELGPHAHEKQMPSWLVKLLETQDGAFKSVKKVDADGTLRKSQMSENHAVDIIPVIQQLLEQDPLTEYAYLCQPSVKHISKLKREGGFCGYRNIQMLCSWIVAENSQGFEHFKGKVPTIFEIQDYIETGWDLGINVGGRIETGGVRGTRKYIGTPEAQTMFISLGIECETQAFKSAKNGTEVLAYELLLNASEKYFIQGAYDFDSKFRQTDLPPIYFQQPGHSMTIIGFEMKKDGSRNILVFDPMFHDASAVTKYIGRKFTEKDPADLLRAYRRGTKYLRKYREFETLRLTPPGRQDST